MSTTETQGIASLEIMACGCPLFVIDATRFDNEGYSLKGASSVTCWDDTCGIKSSMETLKEDFPRFLAAIESYDPRGFVEKYFSQKVAAGHLRNLMEKTLMPSQLTH
jgi:hypothetical protein